MALHESSIAISAQTSRWRQAQSKSSCCGAPSIQSCGGGALLAIGHGDRQWDGQSRGRVCAPRALGPNLHRLLAVGRQSQQTNTAQRRGHRVGLGRWQTSARACLRLHPVQSTMAGKHVREFASAEARAPRALTNDGAPTSIHGGGVGGAQCRKPASRTRRARRKCAASDIRGGGGHRNAHSNSSWRRRPWRCSPCHAFIASVASWRRPDCYIRGHVHRRRRPGASPGAVFATARADPPSSARSACRRVICSRSAAGGNPRWRGPAASKAVASEGTRGGGGP